MRIIFLVIFALSIIIPIGVNDAFAADGSVKLTVEINDSTASGLDLENRDFFGVSVANIGDLDGDGVNDIAVGAPYTHVPNSADGTDWCCEGSTPYADRGSVFILFMNTDGSVKSTVEIDDITPNGPVLYTNDWFGWSVANIGDLDGDGVNDLAVGAKSDNGSYHPAAKDLGAVHIIFMNTDGSVKSTVEIDNTTANGPDLDIKDYFGSSVANIGDLDGDGVNELAGGAPYDLDDDRGALHIMFMNTDGSIKSSVEINSGTPNGPTLVNSDLFGRSVANMGDLDGDGVNDLAVGATHDDNGGTNRGAVHIIFMNTNGSVKSSVEINSSTTNGPDLNSSDFFSVSVANIGDLDGDGVNDLAAGAKGDNAVPAGANRGAVHIMFMNTDGSVKSTVEINSATSNGPTLANTDIFGYGVTEIGDLDGNCVNDLAVGAPQDDNGGVNRGAVHILFMKADAKAKADCEITLSDCYDCDAPKLTKVEVHITSPNSDTQRISTSSEIWNFDQYTPLPMFGDSITPIVADPGDEVEIILELTDNRTLKTITDSGTYTNFLNKPDDMNLFYANNFDKYGKVSTTFYEWYQTGDDLFYDYANTVEWSEADVTIQESGEFAEEGPVENLDELVGTFTISFKMKFLQPMQTTDVWIQVTDLNGNFFKVALPLTLEISGPELLVFDAPLRQKVVSFFDEEMLTQLVSNWDGSSQDVAELELLIGIPAESVPKWVVNLATWVAEDKITTGDMIIAIEHLINN